MEHKGFAPFDVPQVRALKLRVIEEFFDRWDFDGIELDWLRHTLNFRSGAEREGGKYLTEFMREVRRALNERARKRGRPIEVGVRIPECLEWCLEGGFEVPTWISEDLVDFLILGQALTEVPCLSEFRALMKTRRLPLYPCLYSYGSGYRISPDEVIRGTAANLWRDGADGLYTFNWFAYGTWRRQVLNEIADPHLLRGKDKQYTLVHRFPRGEDCLRYNTVSKDASLPFQLTSIDRVRTVFIPVGEDPVGTKRPRRVELWIAVEDVKPGNVLGLSLNDRRLEPLVMDAGQVKTVGYRLLLPAGNGMLGFPPERSYDLRFEAWCREIPATALVPGRNKLAIELLKNGGADKPFRVTRVELCIRF